MKRAIRYIAALLAAVIVIAIAYFSVRIEQQSTRDEAQPADIILVLGAAEYRGRPSSILFRDVSPNVRFRQCRQRVVAVISLVGHRFPRTFRMDSFAYLFVVRRRTWSATATSGCGRVFAT